MIEIGCDCNSDYAILLNCAARGREMYGFIQSLLVLRAPTRIE